MNINEGHVHVKGDAMASPALYELLYMMAVQTHVKKLVLWGVYNYQSSWSNRSSMTTASSTSFWAFLRM